MRPRERCGGYPGRYQATALGEEEWNFDVGCEVRVCEVLNQIPVKFGAVTEFDELVVPGVDFDCAEHRGDDRWCFFGVKLVGRAGGNSSGESSRAAVHATKTPPGRRIRCASAITRVGSSK